MIGTVKLDWHICWNSNMVGKLTKSEHTQKTKKDHTNGSDKVHT